MNVMKAPTTNENWTPRRADSHMPTKLDGKLYRYHNFRVLDAAGAEVGVADWIWAHEATGQGAFIGIRLNWLIGKAKAIPASNVRVDTENATLRVPFMAEEIKRARSFSLGRSLTAEQQDAVWAHYNGMPAAARGLANRFGLPI
jgi:hypothetical protein